MSKNTFDEATRRYLLTAEQPCFLTCRRGHRRSHVHEAEGAAWERFSAPWAAGDLRLGGRAADPVLAETSALVGHGGTAERYGLPTEVTAHKHLNQKRRESMSGSSPYPAIEPATLLLAIKKALYK